MLTTHEASDYLRLSRRTLERLRVEGTGPKFVKIGRCVRYIKSNLDDWLAARSVRSTSEASEVGAV
jgi:excisionase family DNA binding protein